MKALVLVLDGVGVGVMDPNTDGRVECNTVASVVSSAHPQLPTLERLGLLASAGIGSHRHVTGAYGRARLAYQGADSYLGHQELLGTIPPAPTPAPFANVAGTVAQTLKAAGRSCTPLGVGPALIVDGSVTVGDNLEAAPGQAVNVIAPTRQINFEAALEIGEEVRAVVGHSRVIVCGGRGFAFDHMLQHATTTPGGQHGVPTAALGLYDETFEVRHLGLPVEGSRQLPQRLHATGEPTALIGKVADLADGAVGHRSAPVATSAVLGEVGNWLEHHPHGLVVATVQETDLAGHERDPIRMAAVLEEVDGWLGARLDTHANETIVVTADHGTDPLHGDGQHTREHVPVLWHTTGIGPTPLGTRCCLADIVATLAPAFGLRWTGDGTPLPLREGNEREARTIFPVRQRSSG